jgi:capsular exopolysaccharide synthesis family protein
MADTRDALRRAAGRPSPERSQPVPSGVEPEPARPTPVAISPDRAGSWQARAVVVDRYGVAAAYFQRFAWKVRRELEGRSATSVAITSSVRDEGKTVTACNLALAMASYGSGRIALVDLDLRGPSVWHALGIQPEVGIERCLTQERSIWDVRVATDLRRLDVFPARRPLPDAHEALGGPALGAVLDELRKTYDVVVIDSPPVLPVPDTPLILRAAESCVCVVRAGHTHPTALQQTLELLPRDKLLGLFLNSVRSVQHADEYRYYPKNHA